METAKVGIIIDARTNQGRWPNKILADLGGKPVVEQTIIRTKKVQEADVIILATSNKGEDLQLMPIAHRQNVEFFQGDAEDVLQRNLDASIYYGLNYYIGMPASWPLFDIGMANDNIKAIRENPGYDEYCFCPHMPGTGLRTNASSIECLKRRMNFPGRPLRNEQMPSFPHTHFFVKTYEEMKNYQLISLNIAYPMHLAILNKIIDHLGHYPEDYQEIVKAYWEIKKL